MKISYKWLSELVDLEILEMEVDRIAQVLTMLGLAVEGVESAEDDVILDVDVTSNRPDCLNHVGVARELAAHFALKLKLPMVSDPSPIMGEGDYPASVKIEAPDLCPRYSARVLSGIQIGDSPAWLKQRLTNLGQRPVNNVVDVTNYVMLELGQPLHAFDYDALQGHQIIVRRARRGETLTTLDRVSRELSPATLLICDAEKPVAIAGVMGGAESEVGTATTAVLLESACFDPASIRTTSRTLGLRSEASQRFERGSDPELPVRALNRAARLLLESQTATSVGALIDEFPEPKAPAVLELSYQRIRQVCGVDVPPEFLSRVFASLGFQTEGNGSGCRVTVPSFRVDIGLEDDLVEEAIRHYGYEKVEATYPAPRQPGGYQETEDQERAVIEVLTANGFFEAVNYAFSVPETQELYWGRPFPSMIEIQNPLTDEDTHLRSSLVPGLVQSLSHNLRHGLSDVRLFEIGKVYSPVEEQREESRLGLIASGAYYDSLWRAETEPFNFFHLKGIVAEVWSRFSQQVQCRRSEIPFLHPGICADVIVGGEIAGFVGQLHPRLQEHFKLPAPVLVAELTLEGLYSIQLPEPRYGGLERFPAIHSDFSFLVDTQIEFARMEAAIKELSIPDLRDVELIDLYQGPELPTGKVSLTVRLTFTNSERTLTQEEVNRYGEEVSAVLRSSVGSELRS